MSRLRSRINSIFKGFIVFSVTLATITWIAHSLPTTAATPPTWDISTPDGTWELDLILDSDGSHRYHTMTINSFVRSTGVFDGIGDTTGTVPPPASILYHWDITSGSVEGNTITWSLAYQEIVVNATLTGTITNNTSMSGTWFSGSTTGTWTATSGQATGLARLTVTKHLVPTNDPGLFNLFIDATPYVSNIGDSGSTGSITIEAGTHTVSETAGTGTIFDDYNSIIDEDCAANGSITLAPSDSKFCTITNTRKTGTITFEKIVIGGTAQPIEWTFDIIDGPQDIGHNDQTMLSTGIYIVTEDGGQNNTDYNLTGASGACALGQNTITLTVTEAGGTCTITNTRKTGALQILKNVDPDAPTTNWLMTVTGLTSFNGILTGDDSTATTTVDTGAYSIVETGGQDTNLNDYDTAYSCTINGSAGPSGAGMSIDVSVAENDAVVCTFTNTIKRGSIVVHKDVVNPSGGEAADTTQFVVILDGQNQQPLAEGTDATYSDLLPGIYTIGETGPSTHYLMTAVDPADADAQTGGYQVTVAPGQTVDVTITNRQHAGRVIVHKEIVGPDGDPDVEDSTVFTASVDTDSVNRAISENNSATFTVHPGLRTVSEIVNSNYELVGFNPSNQVTVGPDETVEVTITNKPKVVTIRVDKVVQDVNGIATTTDSHVFQVTVGNETKPLEQNTTTVFMLPAGTYSITESPDPGYDIVNSPLPVSLSAGQSILKTITNRQKLGKIVVHKDVVNPNGEDVSDATEFQIQLNSGVDTAISENATTTFDTLAPGAYTLTETTHAGYEAGTFSTTTPIILDPGETVEVTVTNRQKNGKIIIEKQTDPADDLQSFGFTGEIQTSLVDNDSEMKEVVPGQYSVSETIPAGWDLASIACDDSESQVPSSGSLGNATATFNIEPGETVKCVFTNFKRGTLTVVKEAVGGDASFTFKHPTSTDTFVLVTVSGRATTTFELSANTAYDVTEQTPPAGWQQVGETVCQGTLTAGGAVECRFVNKKKAVIEVKKTSIGEIGIFHFTGLNGLQGFDLATTVPGQPVSSFFDVFVDQTGTQFTITEEVPSGWSVDQQNCSLTLFPGQETDNVCSFTNTKLGSITIVKDAVPDGPQDFEFSGPRGTFFLDDDQDGTLPNSTTTNDLLPGTYSVTETVPAGWDLTSAMCSDQSNPASIDLSAGEEITCTFTNTKRGTLTIVKNAIGGNDTFTFEHPTSTATFDLTTIGGHATTTFEIPAGTPYDVTEQPLTGWDLTSDPHCQGSFNPGESKTCTFENMKRSKLQVRKTTTPSGDPQQFEVVISGTGTVFGSATGTVTDIINYTYDLTAGTYNVVETLPDGWIQTENGCLNKIVDAGTTGQNCTIKNTKLGKIVVHKNVVASDNSEVADNTPFTVQLNGADDQLIMETATVTYENLVPDDYTLSELQNLDYETPSLSTTTPFVVSPGQTVEVTITNKQKPGSISGMKWNDLNSDGVKDGNESGLAGWTITLNPGNVSTTTNASGNYSFEGLPTGAYTVTEVQNPDWDQTFPTNPVSYSVEITPNLHVTGKNFGNQLRKGKIIIEKQTLPDGDPTQFPFTGHPSGQVGDGGELTEDVEPGQYQSTETIPASWMIESIICDDSNSSGDPQTGVVTFNVAAGETIRCVVTNKKAALITASKTSIGGVDTFPFTGDLGAFSLTTIQSGTPTSTSFDVFVNATGTDITIIETAPEGWDINSPNCLLADVVPGDSRSCSFTNIKHGTLTVIKNTVGDDGTFDFNGPEGAFQLATSGNTAQTSFDLPAGASYEVTETVPPGWYLTQDPNCSGSISTGDEITCTFENTRGSTLIIKKTAIGGDDTFSFDGSQGAFDLTTSGGTGQESFDLIGGSSYNISEVNIPSGWQLSQDFNCQGIIDPGDTVTCTFENTKRGSLTIVKEVVGGDDTFTFTKPTTTEDRFMLMTQNGRATTTFELSASTAYNVSETVPEGWDLTQDPHCAGTIDPGENVECRFMNVKRGKIIVDKVTDPADDPQEFTFTPSWDDPFSLADADQPYESGFLTPSTTYSVSETVPTGWNLISATCNDGSDPSAIHLEPGEIVTCTFTNHIFLVTIRGMKFEDMNGDGDLDEPDDQGLQNWEITLSRVTEPPVGPIQTEILALQLTGGDGGFSFPVREPGRYRLTETLQEGWRQTAPPDSFFDVFVELTDNGQTKSTDVNEQPLHFGNSRITQITGKKFNDANGNGVLDEGEGGLEGWRIVAGKEVETLLVDSANSSPVSSSALENGFDYLVRVSGTYLAGDSITADAKYSTRPPNAVWTDLVQNYESFGTEILELQLNGISPNWGSYNSNHVYWQAVTGTGAPLDFLVNDIHYPSNFGNLTVTIYKVIVEDTTDASGNYSLEFIGQSGDLVVAEQTQGGWVQTSPTPSGFHTVPANETSSDKNFGNHEHGTLKVVKVVNNDNGGTAQVSDFMLFIDGERTPSNGDEVQVPAGSHEVTESGPQGYEVSFSPECEEGEANVPAGQTVTCTVTNDDKPAKLILVKHLPNNNGGIATESDFTPSIDGNPVVWGENAINAGSHTVSETTLNGYTPSDWSNDCAPDSTVTLALGETKTCEITNDDQSGTLHVVKVLPNDDGGNATPDQFFFSVNGGNPIQFEADGQNDVVVDAGEYNIVEVNPLTGYAVSYQGCENVTIPNGGEAFCTITNDDEQATIMVKKIVMNDNGGNATTTDFALFIGLTQVGNGDPLEVNPGSYVVSETGPSGYTATFTGDCDEDGNITVELGEHKTCTITNDDIAPSVKLIKEVTNNNGGIATTSDFDLLLGGVEVPSGVTTTVEANIPIEITELSLTGYSFVNITGDAKCPATLGGTVTLDEGEHVECTITNDDQLGTLHVVKELLNDNGGTATSTQFFFSINGGDPIQFETDGTNDLTVDAGEYDIVEVNSLTGYAVSYQDCENVVIPNGGEKTCTITNDDQPATIHVIKQVMNDNGGNAQVPDFPLFLDGNPIISSTTVEVLPGAHTVSEADTSGYRRSFSGQCTPEGWDLSGAWALDFILNSDSSHRYHTMNVSSFDSVTGSFSGTGSTTGTVPPPAPVLYTWTMTGTETGNSFMLVTSYNEIPGYTVTITGTLDGSGQMSGTWADNGSATGTFTGTGTPEPLAGKVTVGLGENAVCTITNDDEEATITVEKIVIIDNGGTAVVSDFTLFVGQTQVVSGSPFAIAQGNYVVSETGPAGYTATFSGDCDAHGNITAVLGGHKTCTITNDDEQATITVIKLLTNDNGGNATTTDFTLLVDTTPVGNGDPHDVVPGSYVVSEIGPSGYAATFSGDCDEGGNMPVALGEHKTCTIMNDDISPSVILIKNVTNNNGGNAQPTDFDLMLGGVEVQSGATTTVDANIPIEITELSLTGYVFENITGDPQCPTMLGGTVTLNVGEYITCTITNDDQPAAITVEKIVINDNGGTASTTDFTLFVDSTQVGNGDPVGVTPGEHVISESGGPSGYSATFSGDCDAQGNVTVALGGPKKCTITNDDQASHLVVKKTTFPSGDPTVFSITASGTGEIVGGGEGTVTDAIDKNYEVTPGTYLVSEGPDPDWEVVSNSCHDIVIGLGETKTCEIVNKKFARLTVSKATRGGTGIFHFIGIGDPGGFDLTTVQENTPVSSFFDVFVDVQGISYTIQEDAVAGWTQTPASRTCAVSLKPGDQKVCAFVNEKNAGLTVVKHAISDNGGLLSASDFTLHVKDAQGNEVPGSPAAGSESGTFYELAPGTYAVSENNQSGYARTFSGDCDTLGKVTLGPNEQKTCTITNDDISAKIKVVKIVVNNNGGTKQVADFPLFIDVNPTTSGQIVNVSPGLRIISETNPGGYSASFSGECDAGGNMTLALGQTKVCFLTNDDEVVSSISGVKFEDKNANGVRDLGDPGLPNIKIYLDLNHNGSRQVGEPHVVTNANGRYSFGTLTPGIYDVRENLAPGSGWIQSHPASGKHMVTVVAGQEVTGKNFGNYRQGKISGVKFEDKNNNGQKDPGEPFRNEWVITLKRNGQVVGTKTTTNGGKYQFINLDPGLYEVSETLKVGWAQTYPGGSGIHEVDLESGGNVIDRDFGNFKLGVIGGVKYNDVNGNGTRQVLSEPGLSGWTIHLVNTGNGQQQTKVTGAGGAYSFGNLPVGTYTMWEQPQGPWIPTEPGGGIYQNLVISSSGQVITKNFGNKSALPILP